MEGLSPWHQSTLGRKCDLLSGSRWWGQGRGSRRAGQAVSGRESESSQRQTFAFLSSYGFSPETVSLRWRLE